MLARTRLASVPQHAGRLQRDAADVSTALRQLHDALNRMTASGAAITALLPASMLTSGQPWDKFFGAEELRQMTLLEGHRQGRENQILLFDRPPAARALERSEDGSLPALSDRIAELTASVRARFDQAAPIPAADKPAAEHADKPQNPLPVVPTSPAAGAEAQPWPAMQTSGEVIDLRGRDLGVPKQPTDQPDAVPLELNYFGKEE